MDNCASRSLHPQYQAQFDQVWPAQNQPLGTQAKHLPHSSESDLTAYLVRRDDAILLESTR